MLEQGHDINARHHFLGCQHGVGLRTRYRILNQDAVSAETKLRKSGEERKIHSSNLVVARNKLIRQIAHYGSEALGRKHPIHQYACRYQYKAEQRSQRDTCYFKKLTHVFIDEIEDFGVFFPHY